VMAALPNIGGALCSTPQSLADAHYYRVPCCNAAKMRNPLKFAWMPCTYKPDLVYKTFQNVKMFGIWYRMFIDTLHLIYCNILISLYSSVN